LIHRTEPNRPHISSDILFSNSVETTSYGKRSFNLRKPLQ
jgi:hypothetical protein